MEHHGRADQGVDRDGGGEEDLPRAGGEGRSMSNKAGWSALSILGAILLFLACIGVIIALRWQKKQSEPSSAIYENKKGENIEKDSFNAYLGGGNHYAYWLPGEKALCACTATARAYTTTKPN